MGTNPSNLYEGFNFIVTIDSVPVASFAECILPSVTIESTEYREGMETANNTHKVPGLAKYGDLTLKRGLAQGASTTAIWDWVNGFIQGGGARHNVTVTLLGSARTPVITWTFSNCWPVKYELPALNAKTSSLVIETLVVSVDGMTMATAGGA